MSDQTLGNEELDGIAIVGMAGRFPGAANVSAFWQNLVSGVDAISQFSDKDLEEAGVDLDVIRNDPDYVRAGGVLDGADRFDASFFGMNRREAELTDPQHRVLFETAWEALEHAGYNPDRLQCPVGVFVGKAKNTYFASHLIPNKGLIDGVDELVTTLGNETDYLATRISYLFNLRGPSVNIHTACSTSLVAVYHACQSLWNYQCDLALSGGVCILLPQKQGYRFHEGHFSSPDGRTRAYDANGQGTLFSNGVGVVVLKRLSEALADRDSIMGRDQRYRHQQ